MAGGIAVNERDVGAPAWETNDERGRVGGIKDFKGRGTATFCIKCFVAFLLFLKQGWQSSGQGWGRDMCS